MSQDHQHSHAGHSHAPADFNRAFITGILLNSGFVATEAVFGFFAHSLALLADAGHNLGDVVGLLMAWAASLTAHLVKPDGKLDDPLLDQIQHELHDRFGIEHMTVQLECGNADHSCSQEPKHVV